MKDLVKSHSIDQHRLVSTAENIAVCTFLGFNNMSRMVLERGEVFSESLAGLFRAVNPSRIHSMMINTCSCTPWNDLLTNNDLTTNYE